VENIGLRITKELLNLIMTASVTLEPKYLAGGVVKDIKIRNERIVW
jgi:hypothetical protein